MDISEIKDFLDFKSDFYNNLTFIESDPISIPHQYDRREDIEISGLLASVISWGNRKSIITNSNKMMSLMGNAPFDFVMSHKQKDLNRLSNFVHRTFNGNDLIYFVKALKNIYVHYQGPEAVFRKNASADSLQSAIVAFKEAMFSLPHESRTRKHLPDPLRGSAAKRMNMFLRWMVRKDSKGVDFGIWTSLSPSQLSCPLDVHSGRVARKIGLLDRTQSDAKAVAELDKALRNLDPADPVKYDFALFGLGVFEKF